jgi:rubrerythrin
MLYEMLRIDDYNKLKKELIGEIRTNIHDEQKAIDNYNKLISHLKEAGFMGDAYAVQTKIRDDEAEHKKILIRMARDIWTYH